MIRMQEKLMNSIKDLALKLFKREDGGEVLEYALIAGLIVVGAIVAITSVGTKVLARWNSVKNSI
jgi:pilus assembly protein Flp/PilA